MVILAIILCIFLLYRLQDQIYYRYWDKGLSTSLRFHDTAVREGDETILYETVENNKVLPLVILHVKFQISSNILYRNQKQENVSVSDQCYKHEIFSCLPHTRIRRAYPIICQKRGFYQIKEVDLISTNLFLANQFVDRRPILAASILVFPGLLPVDEVDILFRSMMGTILTKQMSYEDPFFIRGVRDYQPFDSQKSINWKASARCDRLLVNEYDYTAGQEVRILVNLEDQTRKRNDEHLECSIRLAASLAARFLENQIAVSVVTNGADILTGEIRKSGTGSDRIHLRTINEILARIDLEKPKYSALSMLADEYDYSNHSRSSQVSYILISYVQREDLKEAFEKLLYLCNDGLWIIPTKSYEEITISAGAQFSICKWEVNPAHGNQ